MLGGLGAYVASEISGALRRNLVIYGLYSLSALLALCAFGYALAALHTVLALSLGPVQASLWIAGGLMLAAIIALLVAIYLRSRPRPSRPMARTALVAAPLAAQLLGKRLSWKVGALAGILALGVVLGRQIFDAGKPDDEA